MKRLTISDEEKQSILEMHRGHHSPDYQTNSDEINAEPKGEVDEILWDDANLKAMKSHMGIKDENKVYILQVLEPFTIKTRDTEEFYKLKFLLMKHGVKFEHSVKND
jgi:hypothetical protein